MSAALDRWLPGATVRTRYATDIAAPPEAVWQAIHAVTPRELPLTSVLVALRSLPALLTGRGTSARLAARPFVESFTRRDFAVLEDDPPRALVIGGVGAPWRVRGGEAPAPMDAATFRSAPPQSVRMAIDFALERRDGGTRLATETRVLPLDDVAARRFGRYWRVIRLGSGLIRRDLLHAIRRRAERATVEGP